MTTSDPAFPAHLSQGGQTSWIILIERISLEYISMTKSSWNRTLDLGEPKSTARKPKAKAVKPRSSGILSDRQTEQHQKAIIAVARWTTRLTRAANEVAKHTKSVKRYERLIAKNAPREEG
jgi:hypothetical protein